MRYSKSDKAEALESFRRLCPPGTKVYTILRSVSRSGMSRTISLVAEDAEGNKTHPNWCGAVLTGNTLLTGFNDAIRVNGCGMDMGFDLVDSLSHAAYGKPCQQGRYDADEAPATVVWAGWL